MASSTGKQRSGAKLTTALTVGTAVIAFLNRPEVRDALTGVSAATKRWAARVRHDQRADNGNYGAVQMRGLVKDRYGAGALLRRLDNLAAAIADIETLHISVARELAEKERDLRTRITATSRLSKEVRRPKLKLLASELSSLEETLANAIG